MNSGHPGSITSEHASGAQLAFEQLTLLVKESPAGRELARPDIRALLDQLIDVVVQCAREQRGHRFASEIWYREGGNGRTHDAVHGCTDGIERASAKGPRGESGSRA